MNKTKRLEIRLSPSEEQALDKLAAIAHCSKSQVVRLLINGTKISAPPPVDYYKFLTAMNRIGANLNQIARIANSTKIIDGISYTENVKLIQELLEELKSTVEGNTKDNVSEKLLNGYYESSEYTDDDYAIPDEF